MECCNYEGRVAHYWEYGYPYSYGYSHYPRYYRYDYPPAPQAQHNEHAMHMDYSAYAPKESRARRSVSRRHSPAQHFPLPSTPPLECGVGGRGAPYFEPQMWSYYQMGMGGGSWNGGAGTGWPARSCFREHMRYAPLKSPHMNQNPLYPMDGRSTPFNSYEHTPYVAESSVRPSAMPEYPAPTHAQESRYPREKVYEERRSPPEEKRPPIVPLPAFQQAFGSTERGKFAEAFSRTEAALDEPGDNFVFDAFPEWDASADPQHWPANKEIKCEENY